MFLSPLAFLELLTFMIASDPITLFATPSHTSYMEDPYLDICRRVIVAMLIFVMVRFKFLSGDGINCILNLNDAWLFLAIDLSTSHKKITMGPVREKFEYNKKQNQAN